MVPDAGEGVVVALEGLQRVVDSPVGQEEEEGVMAVQINDFNLGDDGGDGDDEGGCKSIILASSVLTASSVK